MSSIVYAEPVDSHPLETSPSAPVQPSVSVVIPAYNEERFIGKALENLVHQYSHEDYEIVVVDGMSGDHTRKVVEEFQQLHPEVSVRLVSNPERKIPHALNLGIASARGEIIARIDAHAAPSAGYIRRSVEVLSEGAAIVGMPCRVRSADDSVMGRAIAIGVSHPFGIGDAKYRIGGNDQRPGQEDVDTVAFACFRKSLWFELGGYDEKLQTNEDYDFNYRVRLNGGRVVLDRSEHCDYFARPSLARLAQQYLRYGFWKARMIKQHPRSIKLRHLVAPAFVSSLLILAAIGFLRSAFWALLILELTAYFLAAVAFACHATRKARETVYVVLTMPLVFLTIHTCWGASFLWGLVAPRGKG